MAESAFLRVSKVAERWNSSPGKLLRMTESEKNRCSMRCNVIA